MKDDKLTEPNSEVITWHTVQECEPPRGVKLFLRVEYSYGAVDFTTGYWLGKDFTTGYLQGNEYVYPPVTHWALSEAANKVWFSYVWRESKPTEQAPPGLIL